MLPKPPTFSQAHQDRYVAHLITHFAKDYQPDAKKYFLDVGASHPIMLNNTMLLEDNHNWSGVSLDYSNQYVEEWRQYRRTPLLCCDALKCDFVQVLNDLKIPHIVDYLSLDIDEHQLELVEKVFPWSDIKFKVASIEHDAYRFGAETKDRIRTKLTQQGYILSHQIFWEDWYINPEYVDLPMELIGIQVEEPDFIMQKLVSYSNFQLKYGLCKTVHTEMSWRLNDEKPYLKED